jgi:signal transduction histidine kinase
MKYTSIKLRIATRFWELGLITFLLSLELYLFLTPNGSVTALIISVAFFSAIIMAAGYIVGASELWPFKKLAEGGADDPAVSEEAVADEVRQVMNVMEELKNKMDEAVLSQKRFLADASHEMRSPITVMKGNIEIALRRERDAEEYRSILRSNLEEIDRLEFLLKDLMFLARADANELVMNMAPMRLDDLLLQVVESLTPVAYAKNIELSLHCLYSDECAMVGDKDRLKQLFVNLIENGIRYTPNDGKVAVTLDWLNGVNEVVVSDTGMGIPENEIPKLFERFYRVDKARSRVSGGTGLGLCICKWIVDAHDGEISFKSKEGVGTDVTVMLLSGVPVKEHAPGPPETSETSPISI